MTGAELSNPMTKISISKLKLTLFICLIGVILTVLIKANVTEDQLKNTEKGSRELIFFDMDQPSSYDPLDGDVTVNLFVMRTLYATPLEITPNNVLTSAVLDSFKYDSSKNQITWIVKKGLKFSDNTDLTTKDVLLSVLRMAHKRPKYPVIKDITGIQDWAKDSSALTKIPPGITVADNTITITFIKYIENPLFRFALEIFSIIPRRCIDVSTSKLTCKIPPQSGFYNLESSNANEIKFSLRTDPRPFHGTSAPTKLTFKYYHPSDLQDDTFALPKNALMFGNEFRLKSENLMKLTEKFKFKYLPSSLFRFFLINPHIPPFDKSECRLLFADTIRSVAQKIMGNNFVISGSLFPSILPGFLSDESLSTIDKTIVKNKCLEYLQNTEFPWVKVKKSRNSFEDELLHQAFDTLGLTKVQISETENSKSRDQLFLENKTAFLSAGSGFWAQEPLGDLQMFFSPGMHPLLRDTIANPNIHKQLSQLDHTTEVTLKEDFRKLNELIYTESTLAVFMHTRRFYAANSLDEIRDLPQAVVAPAAWQVFNIEE
jgi:hypothetical protein